MTQVFIYETYGCTFTLVLYLSFFHLHVQSTKNQLIVCINYVLEIHVYSLCKNLLSFHKVMRKIYFCEYLECTNVCSRTKQYLRSDLNNFFSSVVHHISTLVIVYFSNVYSIDPLVIKYLLILKYGIVL